MLLVLRKDSNWLAVVALFWLSLTNYLWFSTLFSCRVFVKENRIFNETLLFLHPSPDQVQLERVRRIQRLCHEHPTLLQQPRDDKYLEDFVKLGFHYFISPKNKQPLTYCFIPKAGCTTMKVSLLNYSGVSTTHLPSTSPDLHDYIDKTLGADKAFESGVTLDDVKHSTKLIFVRHPFERLVSAYENKVNRSIPSNQYFYYLYWNKLLSEVRGSQVDNTSVPTFQEFVHMLLHSKYWEYDPHWSPYWFRCALCTMSYDFVGKTETAVQDFELLFKRYGLSKNPKRLNKGFGDTRRKTRKYFAQLSQAQVQKLYEIYYVDFLLFDYSIKDYLNDPA